MPPFFTFKDLAQRYGKHVETVRDWFKDLPGLLRPGNRTTLIPDTVVKEFEAAAARKHKRPGPVLSKKNGVR